MTEGAKETTPLREYLLLVTLAALWGSSFTFIKVALESYPPMTIVSTRVMIGGLILILVASIRGDIFPRSLERWFELLVQGILQGGLPFYLITWAEKYVDSGVAGILNSMPPMFVFLITVFLLGSAKFDMLKFLGILIGMIGVGVIVFSGGVLGSSSIWAVLAVLGASCSYGIGAVYGQRFKHQSAFITGGVSLFLAGLITTPAAFIFENPFGLMPELRPTLALIALSLLSTALAGVIFFRLLKTLGSLATTSNAYLRALFSILLGSLFLGEELGLPILGATLFIFLGVFLVTGQFRRIVYERVSAGRGKDA